MPDTIPGSEDRIAERVIREVDWDGRLDGCQIRVEVQGGVVVLKGLVDSPPCRAWAEEAARRIPGVLDVANDLELAAHDKAPRTDAEIAAAARQALEWDGRVPHRQLSVSVSEGVVTLAGDVERRAQARAAEAVVSHLHGVRRVVNEIVAGESVSPREINRALVKALARHAVEEASRLDIGVVRGDVFIAGEVCSNEARKVLLEAARRVPGVSRVDSLISVQGTTEPGGVPGA